MNRIEGDLLADRMLRQLFQLLKSFEGCDQQCLAQFGITVSQGYTLLAFPEEATISMNELSQAMGLANSTMTRMVDNLVGKGLVHRKPDDEDRRVVRVGLTTQGQELRRALEQGRRELLQEILGGLQEGERPAVLHTLERLNAAIAKTMGSCCAG